MSDITQQVILTLSESMQEAARQAANNAPFVRFYTGVITGVTGIGRYRVSINSANPELPVYGGGSFKLGDTCWVVSPTNQSDFSNMFILGKGGSGGGDGLKDGDRELLDQIVAKLNAKVDKADITGEPGQSETKVMSQLAVTNYVESKLGDGLKGVIVNGVLLTVNQDRCVTINVATKDVLGVVKSSTDENKISVDKNSGTMEVNSLNVMKLVQHDEDLLVFNAGGANK